MTEQELKGYAEHLIEEHATDIEYTSIYEMAEDYFGGEEFTEDDFEKVNDLLSRVTVTVTWNR